LQRKVTGVAAKSQVSKSLVAKAGAVKLLRLALVVR